MLNKVKPTADLDRIVRRIDRYRLEAEQALERGDKKREREARRRMCLEQAKGWALGLRPERGER